ncbi:MAG: hypothetical protein JJE39_05840 [Vicinamibacteria bacterium]|nr:hypothetical protein [Vicinamibacteria bacterium]
MALVQATEDNTILQIDFNGDGVFDAFNTENGYRTPRVNPVDATTLTLQRGETYVLDRDSQTVGGTLNAGTVILGSKTLQVEYFYGQAGSNYNTRAVSAFPDGFWGKGQTEMSIGRLPVATSAELAEVIRKIKVREAALEANEPWVRSTLLVADDIQNSRRLVLSACTRDNRPDVRLFDRGERMPSAHDHRAAQRPC